MNPREPWVLRPFHRHQHGSAPLAADAYALDEAQQREKDGTPDADLLIRRHQRDQEGRDTHEHERHDQRGLAPDAITVVSENRGADRPRHKPDRIDAERVQRAGEGIVFGKKQLGEHETGDDAVEKEIVPFDRGTDRGCNHGAA